MPQRLFHLPLFAVVVMLAVPVGQAVGAGQCPGRYNTSTWTNCTGTVTFANGDKYVGEYRDGKRHGQGIYTYTYGKKYVGEWKDNKKHGQGTLSWSNGNKYVGEWRDDKENGHFTVTWDAYGDKYVGEYRNGERTGQGTYTYADGRIKEGIFKDGKFQYAQKVTPTVTARKSPLPSSQGRGLLPPCPTDSHMSTWTGCFGIWIISSGEYNGFLYAGNFRDGKPNGGGTQQWFAPSPRAGEIHISIFRDGKRVGPGTATWIAPHKRAGQKYVGEFKDGKPNGQGIKTFADRRVQEGIWENGKFKHAQKISPMVIAKAEGWSRDRIERFITKSPPKVDRQKRLKLARRIQEALQVLGLYTGKIDGIMGVRTQSAIQRWQKRNGYSATDEINETQLAKLEQEAVTRLAEKDAEPKPKKVVKKKIKPKSSPQSATSGSGFFISKLGHVITNQHVVSDCKKVTVGDNSKKQVSAIVLETDRRNDLALLRISSMEMASVETKTLVAKLGLTVTPLVSQGLLRPDAVELGEDVVVAGFPFGDIFSNTIKITKGVVSAKRGMGDDSGQFQIDAAVQPGNSGGPIYDENGNIIGVVVSQLNKFKFAKERGAIPENVNFGIKASTVNQFLNASGLPTSWSKRTKRMSTKDIAKIAENQTVMVVCHR